jgi:uncharacterized protein (TIGR03435 family)
MRLSSWTAALFVMGCAAGFGQALSTAPKFEVASIKPCVPAPPGFRGGGGGGGSESQGVGAGHLNWCRPVIQFITLAYNTYATGERDLPQFLPIVGGPSWINSESYDINAKAPGSASREMMLGPMLQALLEDRLGLKLHRETRSVPAYALTVIKGGPKLRPAKEGCAPADPAKPLAPGQKQLCGGPANGTIAGQSSITLDAHGLSLIEFSKSLASIMGRPVVDKTGIEGRFDFDLEFLPDESTAGLHIRLASSDSPSATSIFTAIQEQLGLKLEPTRGPGEFIVIDQIQRPSEN